MNLTFEDLVLAVSRCQEGGKGSAVRYPASLRSAAVCLVQERLGQGETITSLSEALGVALATLQHWLRQEGAASIVPVTVAGPGPADLGAGCDIRLVTPRGYRVEGLSVSQVASLLGVLDAR